MSDIIKYNPKDPTISSLSKVEDGGKLELGLARIVLVAQSLRGGKAETVNDTMNKEFVNMVLTDYAFLQPLEVQSAIITGLRRRDAAYTTISIMLLRELLDDYAEHREQYFINNNQKFE